MAKGKAERGSSLSKMKMVKEAMRELGDSSPLAMQAHIKQKYGTDISTQMISSYKSNIRKKEGSGGRGGSDGSVGVRDVALIRDLLDRIGANQLQTLIKVMNK